MHYNNVECSVCINRAHHLCFLGSIAKYRSDGQDRVLNLILCVSNHLDLGSLQDRSSFDERSRILCAVGGDTQEQGGCASSPADLEGIEAGQEPVDGIPDHLDRTLQVRTVPKHFVISFYDLSVVHDCFICHVDISGLQA